MYGPDEVEDENERGGDINDEPHDDNELDDDRDGLAGIADVLATTSDGKGGEWGGYQYQHDLRFDGDGRQIAQRMVWDARHRLSAQKPTKRRVEA